MNIEVQKLINSLDDALYRAVLIRAKYCEFKK